jgi:hypothetical protein
VAVPDFLRFPPGNRMMVPVPAANIAAIREAAGTGQGLTLVHFPAQYKRFVWDRGCP